MSGGLACSESLPNTYPGFPLGRARRTTSLQASPPALGLHGMVKTTCCSWPCADVADAQETVDRAAAAPLGGPQAAPTSNTRASRKSPVSYFRHNLVFCQDSWSSSY